MQYAYVKLFDDWQNIFPSGQEVEFQNEKFIELDSTILNKDTEAEFIRGNKASYKAICPVCQDRVSFNRGTLNEETMSRKALKRKAFFFHPNRDCFSFESLAHGQTKKYLYQLFDKAGYIVREERRHSNIVRADVAVLQLEEGKEELKLAIEVQASNIRNGDIARRINTYHAENVPTAWILVLDSFFPPKESERNGEKIYTDSYSGTRISHFNPDTNSYDYEYISTTEEGYFYVTGSDNKAFNFLMDTYHVIVSVDHNGHVFLIRRTKESARLRIEAMLENRPYSTQDDIFKVSRVAEKNIVPILLETELLHVAYKEIETNFNHSNQVDDEFKGQIHISEYHKTDLFDSNIEFDKAQGMEDSLNTLALIRETREAIQKAYEQKTKEIELYKQEEQRRHEEALAAQMAIDFIKDLEQKYITEFGLLMDRLEREKSSLHLNSIGIWYAWLKRLKNEQEQWHVFVNELYRGFPRSHFSDKKDFNEYYSQENALYKEWIENKGLVEFVSELRAHYNQLIQLKPDELDEIMYFKELLSKYEQKLEKVRLTEAVARKRKEQIRQEEQLLREKEEKKKLYNEKKYWYSQIDLLTKEYHELPHFLKQEIDDVRDEFVKAIMRMNKSGRITFEKELFPLGLPPWILSKKLKIEEKEIKAIKGENKERMKLATKKNKNDMKEDDGFVQLKLL
ncbi:hypothetical protein ACEOWG_004367 [Bacillus cereus]